MQRGPAGVQRSLVDRIAVRNIDMDTERETLVLRARVAHFDDRVADADRGVHDFPVRCQESRELHRVECRFEEVEKIGRSLDDEVGDDGVSRCNRCFCGRGHELSFQT